MKSFAELFKQHRVQARFANLSDFADALSEKGYVYDPSMISLWQRGKRIPNRRRLLITIIAVFCEKGAITSVDEANELLEAADQGYLTSKEQEDLFGN
ncbi:MAG: hypothetical protein AAB553_07635 [Patescibacteria group bacterium]